MKNTGISTGNRSSDNKTWQQFLDSEYAGSPTGRVLIELVAETAWSGKFEVYASLDPTDSYLNISHPTFLPRQSLIIDIREDDQLSVRRVEDAVREHLSTSRESVRSVLDILQGYSNDMQQTLEQIAKDKAVAAIAKAFPEESLATFELFQGSVDLYAFGKLDGTTLYVARALGHEFVGGVARLNLSYQAWYEMRNGASQGQRHNVFWAALARAAVVREYGIQEEDCYAGVVYATEKPWENSKVDQYVVEKVALHFQSQEREGTAIVEFGKDNLPAKTYMATG